MDRIIAAFGLMDDDNLTDKHFGDSKYFDIFEVTHGKCKKLKRIWNEKIEEKVHGDPHKASKISNLLKDADVLVAFRMGPNILRMKKKFVPVIVDCKKLSIALNAITNNFYLILPEVEKSGEKNYITLKTRED